MGKALMGTYTTPRAEALLAEVRALRARVEQLEAALAEAEQARETRGEDIDEDRVVALDDAVVASG